MRRMKPYVSHSYPPLTGVSSSQIVIGCHTPFRIRMRFSARILLSEIQNAREALYYSSLCKSGDECTFSEDIIKYLQALLDAYLDAQNICNA